jgi:hypothetical protein
MPSVLFLNGHQIVENNENLFRDICGIIYFRRYQFSWIGCKRYVCRHLISSF